MHYYLCPYCPPDRESYLYKSHVDDVEYIYEECNDDDCENIIQYTCNKCDKSTKSVHPAKFSPDDRYLRYRIAEKE